MQQWKAKGCQTDGEEQLDGNRGECEFHVDFLLAGCAMRATLGLWVSYINR
jgi:hypothetical protein